MNNTHSKKYPGVTQLLVYTCGIFAILTIFLITIDFVPTTVRTDPAIRLIATSTVKEPAIVDETPVPVRIAIDAIGTDTIVTDPSSTDITVLDRALLSGAVRYPGSVDLGMNGNVLIFGHSSYLPIVKNKAFKAFNELGSLTPGTTIVVDSTTHRYTYEVTDVRLAKADDVIISFTADRPTLTLATCNTFGAKEDRWVVTATLAHVEKIL